MGPFRGFFVVRYPGALLGSVSDTGVSPKRESAKWENALPGLPGVLLQHLTRSRRRRPRGPNGPRTPIHAPFGFTVNPSWGNSCLGYP